MEGEEVHLSEHTLSLRRALANCQRISDGGATPKIQEHSGTDSQPPKNSRDLEAESQAGEETMRASAAVRAARCVPEQRQEALDKIILLLHKNNDSNNTTAAIDIVPDLSQISKLEFQQRYLIRNQPCLIRGEIRNENNESCFAEVQKQWRTDESGNGDDSHSNPHITTTTTRRIRRAWFLETLGSETVVPVRYDPPPPCTTGATTTDAADGLDDDGRAVECATKHTALGDWIRLLVDNDSNEHKESKEKTRTTPLDDDGCNRNYYLKDWHLQSWLEQQEQCGSGNHSTPPRMKSSTRLLYSVPNHFQWDLLNDFLRRFTTGDYRFVYWGPAGSQTTRHSDVMNSFSWSYNVHGVKEWTFEVPSNDDNDTDPKRSLVLLQRSGELVFVPATWKHHVVNLEETLSINHNWITTCNLDLVWECIRKEIQAVNVELRAWNIVPDDNWEARENMLRGCLGLDVSAFFFLCLVRGLDLWQQQRAKGRKCTVFEYEIWFDLVRLADTLSTVLDDIPIDLQNRLEATLCDKTLGMEAVELAHAFIRIVNCMTETVL